MDTYAAELATLRARVEELERERDGYRKIVADIAASVALPDTIRATGSAGDMIAYFKGLRDRADRLSEATRLAVEVLEPFAKHLDEMRFDIDHEGNQLPGEQAVGWVYVTNNDFRRARAVLDRLNAKGESE